MIWHFKSLNLKTILRPSIVGGMPLKCTHVVPSLNFKCTPRVLNLMVNLIWGIEYDNLMSTRIFTLISIEIFI